MLGAPPLGVTGVVAAEVPVEGLKPLPANRCTQSIPLTGSSDAVPIVPEGPRDKLLRPVAAPGTPGLSTLYFKNSARNRQMERPKRFLLKKYLLG